MLDQELPRQPRRACAKGGAHRQFGVASRGADQQQAGDVGAGEQEDGQRGQRQDRNHPPRAPRQPGGRRRQLDARTGVGLRELPLEIDRHRVHAARRPLAWSRVVRSRPITLQVALAAAAGDAIHDQGLPEVRLAGGEAETSRQHADDCRRTTVDHDRLARRGTRSPKRAAAKSCPRINTGAAPGCMSSVEKRRPCAGATPRTSNMSSDTHAPSTCCGTSPPMVALVATIAPSADRPSLRARWSRKFNSLHGYSCRLCSGWAAHT